MTHRGRVIDGQIVLDDPNALPDGAAVVVYFLKPKTRGKGKETPLSLDERTSNGGFPQARDRIPPGQKQRQRNKR